MDLFFGFPPISTSEWHEKIVRDSRGAKTIEDLAWETPEGVRIAPFYRADEVSVAPIPVVYSARTWQLNELITVGEVGVANSVALQALAGGADSLQFVLDNALSISDFRRLFDSVFVEMIGVGFSGQWVWRHADLVWALYAELLTERGVLSPEVRVSFEADPINIEVLHRLNEATDNYSGLKLVNLYASGQSIEQLRGLLGSARFLLKKMPFLASRMAWSFPIGNSFMVEIAKLRAARRIWHTEISADFAPTLHAFTSPMTLTDDIHYNKIMATTQATSAILGGADKITVTPSDVKAVERGQSSDDARRTARNVQHLLRLESHLDKVQDPAAGSYYLEHLTNEWCKEALK